MLASSLVEYLGTYGDQLVSQLEQAASPLSKTGDKRPDVPLLRQPMAAQWDRINATIATWRAGRDSAILSAAPGTGKTIMSMVAVHAMVAGKPYRSLCVCPPHLTTKWKRELEITIPGVKVVIIDHYSDVLALRNTRAEGAEWFVMSNNRAKLGAEWRPAYVKRRDGLLRCCGCDEPVMKTSGPASNQVVIPCNHGDLEKRQTKCAYCGEPLYQWKPGINRWPVASLINRRLRHAFQFLVLDEAHEMRSESTAAGHISAQLASSIKHKLWLTGTMLNGYALSIFPMCFRAMPKSVLNAGFEWGQSLEFAKKYGRIETVVNIKEKQGGSSNRQSQGTTRTTTVRVRPGIVPSLYGDCLLENTIFCQLDDLGYELPPLQEILEPVAMDREMESAYQQMESEIRSSLREMLAAGSKGALSTMLNTLLGWPDHPYGFNDVGYDTGEGWQKVCEPPSLDTETIRPKEQRLLDIVLDNKARGRQCWVYVQMTGVHDILPRLQKLMQQAGLTCEILRSSTVATDKREAWIYKHGEADVIISHPALVQTGLDLFDARGNHNFATLIFYQTGYKLDTLRQAACRAHRIGQTLPCEVWYLYYAGTMQQNAVELMSKKTSAAQAVEGKFSAEGLSSLTSGSESPAMQMAKMLVENTARAKVTIRKSLPPPVIAPAPVVAKPPIEAAESGQSRVVCAHVVDKKVVSSTTKPKSKVEKTAVPDTVESSASALTKSEQIKLDNLLSYPPLIRSEIERERDGSLTHGWAMWRFKRMLTFVEQLPPKLQAAFGARVNVEELRHQVEAHAAFIASNAKPQGSEILCSN